MEYTLYPCDFFGVGQVALVFCYVYCAAHAYSFVMVCHAAFYGGTCLRIFHGLNRFSEDMDFSLLQKEKNFDFEQFFPSIINEFEIAGRTVEITKKDKRNFGKVESAFLKDTTEVYSLTFQYEKNLSFHTVPYIVVVSCRLYAHPGGPAGGNQHIGGHGASGHQ